MKKGVAFARTALVALAALGLIALALVWRGDVSTKGERRANAVGPVPIADRAAMRSPEPTKTAEDAAANRAADEIIDLTEEENAQIEEDERVDEFDSLTDDWCEPAKGEISLKDIDGFVAAFRRVPAARREDCIQRALNLIPDENIMLLAGVLMDKTLPREIIETVYGDILNRDESVKKPILLQILKDRSHPCYSDTAWILEVTGEAELRDSPS